MKKLTNAIRLVWIFGCFEMLFSAEGSNSLETGSTKSKRALAVELKETSQREKRTCRSLWDTPKKQSFSQKESAILLCIQESQEEKEDRVWESDSTRMLHILEDESRSKKNQPILREDSAIARHGFVVDEENQELITLYLHYTLMDIGVRQTKKDINPRCRGCGDPCVPWHFLRSYDFNSTVDAKGRSFLTRSVQLRHRELVDLLLLVGVDINRADSRGVLPLQEAMESDVVLNVSKDAEESMVSFLMKRGARIASV